MIPGTGQGLVADEILYSMDGILNCYTNHRLDIL